ncbi:MAG TPA: response regulator [Pyrinomonadaceae bacterium]|nr:response regulator [Pyrinomonadaceae bacterium]
MRARFWGTRGSIATPGPATNRFGGNTSCVELTTGAGEIIILDCGTGARTLGADLLGRGRKPLQLSILLGHMHWDHIQGFPFFAPAFIPGNQIDVYAPYGGSRPLRQVMGGQMEFTYFPVELDQLLARIDYHELGEGEFDIAGARVSTQFLNHTSVTIGYRFECDGATLVYLTDHEPFAEALWRSDAEPGRVESILHEGDRRHAAFMAGADLVIHDAQYTPEEYASKKTWGHSHYEYVTEVAAAAGVRRLALTHHDPTHDDAFVESVERKAREVAERRQSDMEVFCAYEGCVVDVKRSDPPPPRPAEPPRARVAASSNAPALLLVGGNGELGRLTKSFLEREGFLVSEAADGAEARESMQAAAPDLVLLDTDAPGADGADVLRAMREVPALSCVPVFVVTGSNDEGGLRRVFDAGACDYISKPFSTPQLVSRVRACLSRAARQGVSSFEPSFPPKG